MGLKTVIGWLLPRICMALNEKEHHGSLQIVGDERHRKQIREALDLIQAIDPARHRQISRDLRTVWAMRHYSSSAAYLHVVRTCQLDTANLDGERGSADNIASAIIHEATHARLMHAGIGYDAAIRVRIEKVCVRRELAFARRLGNDRLIHESEWQLDHLAVHYDELGFFSRSVAGDLEGLREMDQKLPRWMVRLLRRTIAARLRRLRRMKAQAKAASS